MSSFIVSKLSTTFAKKDAQYLCLSDIIFFYWWNGFIRNSSLSVLQRLFNLWQHIIKKKPLLYWPLNFALSQLPHHMFHNVYQILKCHRYVRFCKKYHNLLVKLSAGADPGLIWGCCKISQKKKINHRNDVISRKIIDSARSKKIRFWLE